MSFKYWKKDKTVVFEKLISESRRYGFLVFNFEKGWRVGPNHLGIYRTRYQKLSRLKMKARRQMSSEFEVKIFKSDHMSFSSFLLFFKSIRKVGLSKIRYKNILWMKNYLNRLKCLFLKMSSNKRMFLFCMKSSMGAHTVAAFVW